MLRKEEFPKEPIEILKDVLPSEEFKKLEENTIKAGEVEIEVLPVWKWLLT